VSNKVLRIAFLVLSISALLVASMFCMGRLRHASPEQQQALMVMAEKPKFNEKQNLAPYMWLFLYDIPAEKVAETMAADAEKFNGLTEENEIPQFRSQAEGMYEQFNYQDEQLRKYCQPKNESDCFHEIAKDLEKLAPILRESQQALQRAETITDFRVYYSPMETHLETPLPGFQMGRRLLQVHYVDLFMSGQQQLAAEKVCGDMAAWRSVGANTDSMIAAMIANAYLRSDMMMLANMLARMEPAATLPEACSLALKPVAYEENMLCNTLRGEFGIIDNLDMDLGNKSRKSEKFSYRLSVAVLYSHAQTVRVAAPFYASACSSDAIAAAKQNKPITLNAAEDFECDAVDWISNATGCGMLRMAAPDYGNYLLRKLDQSAQVTAMQIVLWLRNKNVGGVNANEAFSARPENLRGFSNRISLNAEAGMLEVKLLSPRSDGKKVWSLPLSGSLSGK
jgi:hypothetical protein